MFPQNLDERRNDAQKKYFSRDLLPSSATIMVRSSLSCIKQARPFDVLCAVLSEDHINSAPRRCISDIHSDLRNICWSLVFTSLG